MRINQEQRVPFSKKTKAWRVNQVDYLCSRADEFSGEWVRMWENYRLLNNQLNQEEYREYCDTLGLTKTDGKKFVEPFNKSHNIINVLRGEENNRPWNYSVINLSPDATNEILRNRDRDIREYLDFSLENEIKKAMSQAQIKAQIKSGDLDEDKAKMVMDQLMQKFQEEEMKALNPEKIKNKYGNYKTIKEVTMHKLLKTLSVNQNLKYTKNETFTDALVAGIEAVHIKVDPNDESELPKVKQVNPLTLFFHKSPDSAYIQDGDYAGYKEEMTIGQVLDLYGEDMHPADRKKLRTYRQKVYGTETPFHSKDGKSQSSWNSLKNFEYGYNGGTNVPYYGNNNVLADGLYHSRMNGGYNNDYCVVYTTFWKSQRMVGIHRFVDEMGVMQESIVAEEFIIPDDAKKETYKTSMVNRSRTRKYWYDDKDRYHSLEWIWIPEIWQGTRINGDIYLNIEPLPYAYQSMLNPYKVKLPIYGYVYNSRNAKTVSIMDRVKPWQKLYYIVMSKWLKLIAQDKGVINLINVLMMDKKLGYEKSLQIAVDHGFLPYNPLAHSQGAALNTYKAADRLDLSNSQQLTHYTQILQFIEQNLKLAAGVNDQRMAQTARNTNVTDNQRDTAHSMNITETTFAAHDLLWQEVLQGLVEMAVMTLDSKSGYVREILSDNEIAVLDMALISMDDEYSVRIANNTKAFKDLETGKQFAQALVQNDKASFSTLMELLTTDNIAEFKSYLRNIEEDIEKREQENQERQEKARQEHEEKIERIRLEQREDEQQHAMDIERLKSETQISVAEIGSFKFTEDQDSNDNQIPDQLEIEKLKTQTISKEHDIAIQHRKLDQEENKTRVMQQENKLDRASKEKIAKQKGNGKQQ